MTRKLAFALSLLGIAFSSSLYALGIGEAVVKSSLNQPLVAEIELVNEGELTPDEILPGLATREEFLRAGVERTYFLSDIRFEVSARPSGEYVVTMTTSKPVREPFLNFLVEVIWPSGRLLREYALLIDPPLFSEAPAAPVNAAPVSAPTPIEAAPVPRPSAPVRPSAPAVQTAGDGTYGKTTSSDTLWDIALKVRPDKDVSPQQVMLAIQQKNPDSFVDSNINKLKTGEILRIPTRDEMTAKSKSQAINEVISQNLAAFPVARAQTEEAAKQRALIDATKDKTAPSQPVESALRPATGDELKLLVSSNETSTQSTGANAGKVPGGSGTDTAMDNKLSMTLEKLDQVSAEKQELSGKVEDLEEQLATLQRLLTLKDDQLAGLQEQMRSNEAAREEADATAVEPAPETAPEAEVAEASQPEVAATEPEAGEEAPTEATEEVEAVEPEPVVETKPAPAPAKELSLVEMIVSNPIYMAAAFVGILILLAILWMVSRSNAHREQRMYDEDDEGDTPFESDPVENMFDEEVEEQEVLEDEDIEEASGDREDAPEEEQDVIAEADVYIAYGRLDQAAQILEEAISSEPIRTDYRLKLLEVYKESGDGASFERQYSELEAIQDDAAMAQADEIKSSFSDSETASVDQLQSELEAEIAAGHEAPAESMDDEEFVATEDENFSLDTVDEDDGLDVDFDPEELDIDLEVDLDTEDEPEASTSDAIEFEPAEPVADDIDDAALDAAFDAVTEEMEEAEADDVPLELELEDDIEPAEDLELEAEVDLPPELAGDTDSEGVSAADLELDDIDLDVDAVDEPETAEEVAEPEGDLDLDTEISDEDLGLTDEEKDSLDLGEELDLSDELDQENEIQLPDDLNLDEDKLEEAIADHDTEIDDEILEEAAEALAEPGDLSDAIDDDEDFGFLEGTDEASTKLDLARAYIDMGDVDGARDILEEVVKEGNDDQQKEAQDLISSLG